jgi:hypothetical protein
VIVRTRESEMLNRRVSDGGGGGGHEQDGAESCG